MSALGKLANITDAFDDDSAAAPPSFVPILTGALRVQFGDGALAATADAHEDQVRVCHCCSECDSRASNVDAECIPRMDGARAGGGLMKRGVARQAAEAWRQDCSMVRAPA